MFMTKNLIIKWLAYTYGYGDSIHMIVVRNFKNVLDCNVVVLR